MEIILSVLIVLLGFLIGMFFTRWVLTRNQGNAAISAEERAERVRLQKEADELSRGFDD